MKQRVHVTYVDVTADQNNGNNIKRPVMVHFCRIIIGDFLLLSSPRVWMINFLGRYCVTRKASR